MKRYQIFLLLIVLSIPSYSQIAPDVILGDTYQTVLMKIRADKSYKCYSISQSKDIIQVTIKAHSGLDESSMDILQFNKNELIRMYHIMSNNPHGMWDYILQLRSKRDGEPFTIKVGKHKLTYWNLEQEPRQYFYLANSDWYNRECLYLLTTNEKYKASKRLKQRLIGGEAN